MSEGAPYDRVSRRDVLRYGAGVGAIGFAGCLGGEDNRSAAQKTHDERMRNCEVTVTVDEGRGFGFTWQSKHYSFTVTDENEDGSIDINAVVDILDEEGQNKEAIDAEAEYNRTIEEREAIEIDNNAALYYIGREDGSHRLCAGGQNYIPT